MSLLSISYNSITQPEGLSFSPGFSGSASYESQAQTISRRTPPPPKKKPDTGFAGAPHLRTPNRSKITKKIKAYTRLQASKKFLAFYTITFPAKFSDESAYKSLNIILTRMRKGRKKFSYIWVAERQKNGTIHYHMLTNSFFNVRLVNHFAACAIRTQIYNEKSFDLNFLAGIYNGVDVRRIHNPNKIGGYISKYVTKNTIAATNAVWHCSREVSALFTSYRGYLDLEIALNKYLTFVCTVELGFNPAAQNMSLHIFGFNKSPPRSIFAPIDRLNEAIYNLGLS